MSSITLDRPTVSGSTLACEVHPSSDLQRFFTGEPITVNYDRSIESVPDGILVIPILAQVCPVAWANGADVYVETVDGSFAHALAAVQESLCRMHDFLEGGELYARRVHDGDDTGDGERNGGSDDAPGTGTGTGGSGTDGDSARNSDDDSDSALLFTGGVDSTCSYVRHREEAPTLVSLRGWTITPDPADDEDWATLRERVSAFADDRDLDTAFIETNALSALDHAMLLAHYKRYVDGGWYSSVGHGLGLLGLCAPMAYTRGIDDLYVAATHWDGIDLEWGSRPDIDNHVRWTGTQCHHDAYDLPRQERLDLIADHVEREAPDLELQTCNTRLDGNCGRCEKCYRTAVGLRLSGLDPQAHGYPFTDAEYRDLRRDLEQGTWVLGQDERYMWEDIRERVRETDREPESAAEREFFTWLETADLDELVSESGPPLSHRVLRAGARNAPGSVYNTAYPVWKTMKTGLHRVRLGR
ncbi:hypothetical protein [Natrialba taiwanensis]|uniref:Uncharacterized protein n=1 Tax=Natrialba taiwanensis DSM 12281 TaxID=1230458 RepID=L9ZEP7_9EURY|nr:hypothetical protein [Natrialba taiwanensis]ELY84839.1 hypothetical protein C484_21868 [Natrialba taiwanensis DSM 12281]